MPLFTHGRSDKVIMFYGGVGKRSVANRDDLPNELSGSERSLRDGTFCMDPPHGSSSCSCLMLISSTQNF
jgi:hypothetical protein